MMNCNDIERKILLSGSGELSRDEEKVLGEHLAGCDQCRAYSKSAENIIDVAGRDLKVGEPSKAVIDKIISSAEAGVGRGHILQFPVPALRMLASAAAMLLIAGGVMLQRGGDQSDRGDELRAIISVVSESTDAMSEQAAIFELADQLLILQGFTDVETTEPVDQFEELFPTVLRLRSTRVLLSRKCV
jgi:hypothetical protein